MENVVLSAFATAYVLFLLHRKAGPYAIFLKLRRILALLPYPLSDHFLCSTCAALSIGALVLLISYLVPVVVHVLAVAGAVFVLHGLAGHWHSADVQ